MNDATDGLGYKLGKPYVRKPRKAGRTGSVLAEAVLGLALFAFAGAILAAIFTLIF